MLLHVGMEIKNAPRNEQDTNWEELCENNDDVQHMLQFWEFVGENTQDPDMTSSDMELAQSVKENIKKYCEAQAEADSDCQVGRAARAKQQEERDTDRQVAEDARLYAHPMPCPCS